MNASDLLKRLQSISEASVKDLKLQKLSAQDILQAFKNAGYKMNASDIAAVKHLSFDQSKHQHVYGMVSYDANEMLWLVNRVYVRFGKDMIEAESDGNPSYESDEKAEALQFLKSFK